MSRSDAQRAIQHLGVLIGKREVKEEKLLSQLFCLSSLSKLSESKLKQHSPPHPLVRPGPAPDSSPGSPTHPV